MWENLRESTEDSGLYVMQHFFYLYPEEVQKFAFNMDSWGNVRSDYLTSRALRDHSIKVMNALDSGVKKIFL